MKLLIKTAAVTAALSASSSVTTVLARPDPLWQMFEAFKRKFSIEFATHEENRQRFEIFKQNHDRAEELTKKSNGKATFSVMTKFAHLSQEEFKAKHLGYKPISDKNVRNALKKTFKRYDIDNEISSESKNNNNDFMKAKTIDWRSTGAVTPVKDQGACGSCWAFSATQAVETGYWMKEKKQKILAPEQIVACDKNHEDYGCNGGDPLTAYDYIRRAGGLDLNKDYPYYSGEFGWTGYCKERKLKHMAVKIGETTIVSDSAATEPKMMDAIKSSPMAICVDAETWQTYQSGIVDSSTCGTSLDHCVHLVGYQSNGDYWIVKNSWNTNWGEEGYIYVKKGENACGIAMEATTVTATDYKSNTTVKDSVAEIATQIIEGVADGMGIDMADNCINASEDLFTKLEQAYIKFQKHNPIAIAEALRLIAIALKNDIPTATKACETSESEISNLLKSLEILSHPKQFIYHVEKDLKINGVDIYNEVNDSVKDYNSKEWKEMGTAIGKALYLILVGSGSSGQQQQNEHILSSTQMEITV